MSTETAEALRAALINLQEDLNERLALVVNAQSELRQTRSDIISELGQSANDSYLKARFVSGLDEAAANLRKALLD